MKLNSIQHIENNHLILLAEDDIDDQEMLIEAIKQKDDSIKFLVANTGSKALKLLNNIAESTTTPSLILLDYNLPEISGAEILLKIKDIEKYKDVVKVVWSTSNSPVYQKKCMELGAFSYIVKPNGIEEIRSIAKTIIELLKNR